LNNGIHDGTNGVTECPIPPGGSKTYRWLAEQYGTSWYHSHFSSQYGNGIAGTIVIDGPATLPYDIDLGPLSISDWYYEPADELLLRVMDPSNPFIPGLPGSPPASDNILFNGKHVNAKGGGSYQKVTLTPGKRHRLRIINPSVDNTFTVSLVGHQMTVIANDFVPVNAYTVQSLYLGIGQRFDVTIDASQAVGNYWFNVTFSSVIQCGRSNMPYPAAIFHYNGAPDTLPTKKGTPPADSLCADLTNLSPVVPRSAPANLFKPARSNDLAVQLEVNDSQNRVFWKINNTAADVVWDEPMFEYLRKGNTNFPTSYNVIKVPQANVVSPFP
jgi:FtsP/CotA-like multicopper oxidase with cupredoxin domain